MRDRPDPPEAVTATEGDAATIVELYGHKGRWMVDKDVDALDRLFHPRAMFVHMGATFIRAQELDVIGSGGIEYKKATVHEQGWQLASMSFTRVLTPQ